MKGTRKKIYTFEEIFDGITPSKKDMYSIKYSNSVSEARDTGILTEENLRKSGIQTSNYTLKTRILKSEWIKSRPSSKAVKWLFKEVFKDPSTYRYNKKLIYQGGLFIFEYKNPKYKDTEVLPWFDQFPLVLSLGPVVTNQGVRNLGFNLHLLPPRIRIIVLCRVFELYKRLYRYNIFFKRNSPVGIKYQDIIRFLEMYGVKFCVRMYIPNRMTQIVRFPTKEWHKAIFIPSRGYYGIKAKMLIREWKSFCRKNRFAVSDRINWKSVI